VLDQTLLDEIEQGPHWSNEIFGECRCRELLGEVELVLKINQGRAQCTIFKNC
jgi:hypothetical protein